MTSSSASSLPAAVPVGEPRDALAPPRWALWQLLGFRYLLCHCLLYSLPRPFSLLLNTIGEGFGYLAMEFEWQWLREGPFRWPTDAATQLAKVESWWGELTMWFSDHKLTPVEVIIQPSGSGDTAHDFVKLACIVAISLLVTTLWSLLPLSRRGYPRLGRWLHLFARWDLAFWMLTYGVVKFYSGQFGEVGLTSMTQEIGDKSPMGMVWLFMAASKPYELFGGACEVLGGLLLFHRRTALLGCFVAIAVMTNVCALNWLYDVPVKLFSTHLWLYAVFLLAPYGSRLWALFGSNRPSSPVDLAVVKRPWLVWTLAVFGWSWAVCALVQSHFQNMKAMANREEMQGVRPELYGLWNVEKMLLEGVEVPLADAMLWKSLSIDRGGRAVARETTGRQHTFTHKEDVAAGVLSMKVGAGKAEDWTFTRGTKRVKVAHPEPRTMKDYRKQVSAERRTLVLKGKWGDRQIELHTVERVFVLERGFHWVQELPFHR